jgi:hypothetical protein
MKSLMKRPLVALTGYLAQVIFVIWDKGSFVQDIVKIIFGGYLNFIPVWAWIGFANIPLLFWLKNSIINDLFFISHKLGFIFNYNNIEIKYINEETIITVIQHEKNTYGSETWSIEQWRQFLERNNKIAIGALDKEICIGGISIFPLNEELIEDFLSEITEIGIEIEDNFKPEYIARIDSKFNNVYIPGIALLPYKFRYSGIGRYMIKKSLIQFLEIYRSQLEYPFTIYSIATSKFGVIFLRDYYNFTRADGGMEVFYKVFHTEEIFDIFVNEHTT